MKQKLKIMYYIIKFLFALLVSIVVFLLSCFLLLFFLKENAPDRVEFLMEIFDKEENKVEGATVWDWAFDTKGRYFYGDNRYTGDCYLG